MVMASVMDRKANEGKGGEETGGRGGRGRGEKRVVKERTGRGGRKNRVGKGEIYRERRECMRKGKGDCFR